MQNTVHGFCSICYPRPDKILSKHDMHSSSKEPKKISGKEGLLGFGRKSMSWQRVCCTVFPLWRNAVVRC